MNEIQRNLTPEKYKQLFGQLSHRQMEIISDKESRCIVVAAGPGSGKTRVLVHKLASLLLLEDVKHEQLLMLTSPGRLPRNSSSADGTDWQCGALRGNQDFSCLLF